MSPPASGTPRGEESPEPGEPKPTKPGMKKRLGPLFMFIALVFVAYVYIWRKGALEWR